MLLIHPLTYLTISAKSAKCFIELKVNEPTTTENENACS